MTKRCKATSAIARLGLVFFVTTSALLAQRVERSPHREKKDFEREHGYRDLASEVKEASRRAEAASRAARESTERAKEKMDLALKIFEKPAEYPSAREFISTTANGATKVSKKDLDSIVSQEKEPRSLGATLVLAALPRSNLEYEHIFNRSPSQKNVSEIRDVKKFFDRDKITPSPLLSVAGFRRAVAKSTSSYVIVLGHNTEGNLALLDGSSLPIMRAIAIAQRYKKIPIIISCQAATYLPKFPREQTPAAANFHQSKRTASQEEFRDSLSGTALATRSFLTFNEAIELAGKMQVAISGSAASLKDSKTSIEDLRFQFDRMEAHSKRMATFKTICIKSVIGGVMIVTVVAIVIVLDDCSDSTHPCLNP